MLTVNPSQSHLLLLLPCVHPILTSATRAGIIKAGLAPGLLTLFSASVLAASIYFLPFFDCLLGVGVCLVFVLGDGVDVCLVFVLGVGVGDGDGV